MGALILAAIAGLVIYSQYQKSQSGATSSGDLASQDAASSGTAQAKPIVATAIVVPAKYTLLPASISNVSSFISYTSSIVPQGARYQSR